MDKWQTHTDRSHNKETDDDARGHDEINRLGQEKKKEEDTPALYLFKDSKNIKKRTKKDWTWKPVTAISKGS